MFSESVKWLEKRDFSLIIQTVAKGGFVPQVKRH